MFCNREHGESAESDQFLDLVEHLGLPLIALSSAISWAEAQDAGMSREDWREEYHRRVIDVLAPYHLGTLALAGYMLITSPAMCRRYAMLNLHPALPEGPVGMWREVIWRLLESGAAETGAMMNLATPRLDRGPAISYCHFPIRGEGWDLLWNQLDAKRETRSIAEIALEEGEEEPLFVAIRRHGEAREAPLLYQTLRQFAEGHVYTRSGAAFADSGRLPLDLTAAVEAEIDG